MSDQEVFHISPTVAGLKTFASSSTEFQDIKKVVEQVEGQIENVPILTLDVKPCSCQFASPVSGVGHSLILVAATVIADQSLYISAAKLLACPPMM